MTRKNIPNNNQDVSAQKENEKQTDQVLPLISNEEQENKNCSGQVEKIASDNRQCTLQKCTINPTLENRPSNENQSVGEMKTPVLLNSLVGNSSELKEVEQILLLL